MASTVLHIETPLVESRVLSERAGRPVWLKLENVQPSGSFKIRGIGYLCQRAAQRGCTRLVSSSGGNAGAAVAYAGRKLGIPVTVVVPETTPEWMRETLEAEGANVKVFGRVWDEADRLARDLVEKEDQAVYVSPFDHPEIWEGHATVVDEMKRQLRSYGVEEPPCAVGLSVGGGGLLLGTCVGMRRNGWDEVPILAAETEGAASLAATLTANRTVSLPGITSVAKSLGASQVSESCLPWSQERPILSRIVSDRDAIDACLFLARHHRFLVEPACGAALALALDPDTHLPPNQGAPLVIITCGGNIISPDILAALDAQVPRKPH